jgi:hypothetical protein
MSDIILFKNKTAVELKSYSNEHIVLSGQSIEAYRMSESFADCARIVGRYLIEANQLLNEKRRMPLDQIAPVSKQLLDGLAWNLNFEELSNIIKNGVSGSYGNFYYFDMATIGTWINKYLKDERHLIFEDKEYYREKGRQNELHSMGENHIKLFKSMISNSSKHKETKAESNEKTKLYFENINRAPKLQSKQKGKDSKKTSSDGG